MNEAATWVMISSAASMMLSLVLNIALLVVALVVARKRSGTAAALLAGAAGIFLFAALSPLAYAGASRFGAGTGDYAMVHTIVSLAFALVRAAGWVLLLIGIVKLANPGSPKPIP